MMTNVVFTQSGIITFIKAIAWTTSSYHFLTESALEFFAAGLFVSNFHSFESLK